MFPASIQSAMSEDAYVSFEDFATDGLREEFGQGKHTLGMMQRG
jgi:hypothetical protein